MGTATYVAVNAVFILLALAVSWRWLRRNRRHFIVITLYVLVITLVFDSLIIAAGIVAYDDTKLLGLRLGLAPLEDFAYAVVACMLVPALWHHFAKKEDT